MMSIERFMKEMELKGWDGLNWDGTRHFCRLVGLIYLWIFFFLVLSLYGVSILFVCFWFECKLYTSSFAFPAGLVSREDLLCV